MTSTARQVKYTYSAEDRTGAAVSSVKRGMQSVAEVANMAGFSLAAVGSSVTLGAFASMIKQINDGVDALNDIKDATGASIENISALESVALRGGHAFDVVGQSLIKFNQTLAATIKPGSDAELVLQRIGLSAKELRAMDPAEALRETAVALSQFADDGSKARAVQELFGKSLKEVAPFLNDLATQGALVAKVTTEQAAEAEKFNKELFALNATMKDVGRTLADPVITHMNQLASAFRNAESDGERFWLVAQRIAKLNPASIAGDIGGWLRERIQGPRDPLAEATRAIEGIDARLANDTRLSQADRAALGARRDQHAQRRAALYAGQVTPEDTQDAFSRRFKARTIGDLPGGVPKPVKTLKDAADAELREAKRVAEERQKLRNQESEGIRKFFQEQEEAAVKAARAELQAIETNGREYLAAMDARVLSSAEAAAAAEAEVRALTMTREQIQALTLARIEEQRQAELMTALTMREVDAINAVHDARRRTAEAGFALEQQREQLRTWGQIEQTAHDVFVNIFEDGAGTFKRLGQTLKAAVLDLLYQMTVKKWMISIGASLGVPGAALAQGGAGAAGGAGGLADMLGLGGLAGGGGFGSGLMSGLSAWGEGGSVMGLLGQGSNLFAGGMMNGMGAIMGALGPIILGVGALVALAKATKGETRQGADIGYWHEAGARDTFLQSGGNPMGAQSSQLLAGTALALNTLFASMGVNATTAELHGGFASSDKGRGGVYAGGNLAIGGRLVQFGEVGGLGVNSYESTSARSLSAEDAAKNFGTDLMQVQIQALQAAASEIPATIREMVQGIDAEALSDAQAQQIVADIGSVSQAVRNLREAADLMPFANLRGLSFDAAHGLIELAGGLDQLVQRQESYYANFYSEGERQAQTLSNMARELEAVGLAVPSSRDGFRSLVEAQDLSTEAGRRTWDVLMGVQQAFSDLNPVLDQVGDTAAELADAEREAAAKAHRIAEEGANLMLQLMQLEGNVAGIRAYELLQLDESNRALQERIWGLQDEREAQENARVAHEQYTDSLRDAGVYINGVRTSMRGWVDALEGSPDRSSPLDALNASRGAFQRQLTMAQSGDQAAIGSITQYADRFLSAQEAWSASGPATQAVIEQVKAQMLALPEQLTPEDIVAKAIEAAAGRIETAQDRNTQLLLRMLQTGFVDMDTSLDGTLSFEEVKAALGGSGLATDAELRRGFDFMDSNGDGVLSLSEAMNGNLGKIHGALEGVIAQKFDELDASVDGLLSFDEFVSGLDAYTLGEAAMRELFNKLDENGDGQISRLEAIKGATEGIELDTSNGVVPELKAIWSKLHYDLGAISGGVGQLHYDLGALGGHAYEAGIKLDRIAGFTEMAAANAWLMYGRLTEFATGSSSMVVRTANWGMGTPAYFAQGGAFTNSVVSRPTAFNLGVMGEAGPEAIMPLGRTSSGELGVQVAGGGVSAADIRELVVEQRATRAELQSLRAQNAALTLQLRQVLERTATATETLAKGALDARGR
jgi:Ca2+-binding EF-hand superfamily protein